MLVIGGADCAGPAAASLIWPALTWTVFTLTGFIGSAEPGIAASCWVWITPEVSGAGSGLACGSGFAGAGGSAAAAAAISEGLLAGRGAGNGAGSEAAIGALSASRASSASATWTLASAGLRSVIAAAVRVVAPLPMFSASRLRMMASREPPLRPPSTTPTRKRLPRWIEVTRLKPEARV